MPDFDVGVIDLVIVIVYILATRVIGFVVGRGKDSSEDYFLGGRSFVWPVVGLSLLATNQSGASFVGLAGSGYNNGIAVYNFEWLAAIALIFFVIFILPFYLRSEVFTMPEFLDRRYGSNSRIAFSAFSLFTAMFIDLSVALYGGGVILQALWPEVPLWVSIFALAVLAGIYTMFGGLEAVVITDSIQAVVLLLGGALVAFLTFQAIPSWGAVEEASPGEGMSLIRPIGDDLTPWPGIFTGAIILGFYFWTTNQVIVQRTLGARNLDHGRWGSLFAVFSNCPYSSSWSSPAPWPSPYIPTSTTPISSSPASLSTSCR